MDVYGSKEVPVYVAKTHHFIFIVSLFYSIPLKTKYKQNLKTQAKPKSN